MTYRAVARLVAATGADWRSLMAMPESMFNEVASAVEQLLKAGNGGK